MEIKRNRHGIVTTFQNSSWEKPFYEEFGDIYAEYRKRWNSVSYTNIPPFPLHLDILGADDCMLKCSFCPRGQKKAQSTGLNLGTKKRMPLELFKKIINEAEEHRTRAINFGAGTEPLMNPHIPEMIEYSRNHGFIDIRIITNGHLLTLDKTKELFDAGLTYLSVSVDAYTQRTYKRLRGVDFGKVRENLNAAVSLRERLRLKFPVIRASYIAHPESIHEFEDFLNYWKDIVDFIELQDFVEFTENSNNNFQCMEPFRRLLAWPDGTAGCEGFFSCGPLSYGNLIEQSIYELWHSQKANNLRHSLKTKKYFKDCMLCAGSMKKYNYRSKTYTPKE